MTAVVASGCMDHSQPNRDRPGGPLYQKWQASGERALVARPGGDVVAKIRRRSDRYKVYGADLAPEGFVRIERDSADAPNTDSRDVGTSDERMFSPPTVRTITDEPSGGIERISPSVYEYAGHFRLEKTARGWGIFGRDAEWSGRFERSEGAWTFHPEGRARYLRVDGNDEGSKVLRAGDRTRLTIRVGSLPDAVLLGLGIRQLDLLPGVALGHLLHQMGGGEPAPNSDPT